MDRKHTTGLAGEVASLYLAERPGFIVRVGVYSFPCYLWEGATQRDLPAVDSWVVMTGQYCRAVHGYFDVASFKRAETGATS